MISFTIKRKRVLVTLLSFFIVATCGYHYLFPNGFASRKSKSDATPIQVVCEQDYRISFTFDDGPHPINTPRIVRTLNKYQIKAGFFLLGTSIQSFLHHHKQLVVHPYERIETALLLKQNYSSIERLFDGHEFYLHGWLHEKNDEMDLKAAIDNIATQLVELGLLQGFKPIYRAPWGIGTSPNLGEKKTVFLEILDRMGIIPAYWNIDSEDDRQEADETKLVTGILRMICERKGGHILLHDDRPTTARALDLLIRSIVANGHSIVEPSELLPRWNNQLHLEQARRYVKLLRNTVRRVQRSVSENKELIEAFRLVEVFLRKNPTGSHRLSMNDPIDSLPDSIQVQPNINDV